MSAVASKLKAGAELPADRAGSTAPSCSRIALIVFALVLPFFYDSGSGFIEDCTTALVYVVMALGLNIVVGFAGLLDLGYVAFFAIGAYTMGWLASGFFNSASIHIGVAEQLSSSRASTSTG